MEYVWELCNRVTFCLLDSTCLHPPTISAPQAQPGSPVSGPYCGRCPWSRPAGQVPQPYQPLDRAASLQGIGCVCPPLQHILQRAAINFASWCVGFSTLPHENKGDFQKLIPTESWGKEEPSGPGAVWFIPAVHPRLPQPLVASTYAAASFHWGFCQEWVPVLFFCLIHLFVYPFLSTHPSVQCTCLCWCSPVHRSKYGTQAVDKAGHSVLSLVSVGSGLASLSGLGDSSLSWGWSSTIWIGASTLFCSPSALVSHSFGASKKDRWST